MCVNLKNSEIKKVIINTENLPKNKAGKNDRLAMVKGLEHGHKYTIGLTVIYNDWDEYNTELTITKLLQNREWVNVKDTGENRFGSFSLLFNSLLQGSFKKELQEQSDRYFELVNEMNNRVDKANKETYEQKMIAEKYSREISVLNGTVSMLEADKENLQYQVAVQNNEITTLNKKLNRYEELKLNLEKYHYSENVYNENLETFIQLAETLAQSKVDHETFQKVLKANFKKLFM